MSARPITNVCFHGIGTPQRELEPGEEHYWVGSDTYLSILDVLAELDDVRISFDDSNASDVAHGLPGLVDRGMTATFFVVAGRLGQPGSLDEGDVRHLIRTGMRIGNHGMSHVSWRRMDTATVERELVDARAMLSDLAGQPVDEAALPRGQYDRTTLRHLRRLGYRTVFTSDRAKALQSAWLQPRFSIVADDGPASVRRDILAPQRLRERIERRAAGLAKRLR